MLPTVIKTTTAAVTALCLALGSAAPAHAFGKTERAFVQGVAATLLAGVVVSEYRKNQAVQAQKAIPQPVYTNATYTVPLYQTPAALAFNSYSSSDRRIIQQRLAGYGYYRSGIDGAFGPGTYNAVTAYARDTGNSAQLGNRAGAFGVYDSLIY